jgi:hypothetical protein
VVRARDFCVLMPESDSSFSRSAPAQAGQAGVSPGRTSFSNWCEHARHLYSKIGMERGYYKSMRLAPLALVTGLLPLLCVHLTYAIAASYGHVDWCVPYWDSCTSISATGRELPEKLVFKAIMLPAALCAMAFWFCANQWLQVALGTHSRMMLVSGVAAALFLALYVVALGESNAYRWARQVGVILFFALTLVAQLCFLLRLAAAKSTTPLTVRVLWWQLGLAILTLTVGIASVLLDWLWRDYDSIEDAIEWILMLCVAGQFCSHFPLWRAADLRLPFAQAL